MRTMTMKTQCHLRIERASPAARGGVSGGTIASAVNMLKQDGKLLKAMAHPYYLVPSMAGTSLDVVPDCGISALPQRPAPALDGWHAPFIMAPCNELVVRRSNALLGYGAAAARM